jgi:hypothetical protein
MTNVRYLKEDMLQAAIGLGKTVHSGTRLGQLMVGSGTAALGKLRPDSRRSFMRSGRWLGAPVQI